MTMQCPDCGGTDLEALRPGLFRCMSPVMVGIVPPEMSGMPGPMGHFEPCGYRFAVATPGESSATCGYCTRLAIGSCEDCRRPLCHLHGTARGPFICGSCLEARKTAADKRRRDAERVAEEQRSNVNASVSAADSLGRLLTLIEQHGPVVSPEACRTAWSRLVQAGDVPPTHEIGRATSHECWFTAGGSNYDPGWGWREPDHRERFDAWMCPGDERSVPVWFDAEGTAYSRGGESLAWARNGRLVAIPYGEALRVTRVPGVLLGMRLLPNARSREVVGGSAVRKDDMGTDLYLSHFTKMLSEAVAAPVLNEGPVSIKRPPVAAPERHTSQLPSKLLALTVSAAVGGGSYLILQVLEKAEPGVLVSLAGFILALLCLAGIGMTVVSFVGLFRRDS